MLGYVWCTIDFLQSYNGAVTALATIAIGIFTLALVCVTNRQARLTRKALELGNKELSVTQRPWMMLVEARGGQIVVTPEQATLFVRFTLKNTGNTPAMAVRIHAELFIYTENDRNSGVQIERIIRQFPDVRGGNTFFPKEERCDGENGLIVTRAAINAGHPSGEKVHAAIVGCVFYRFAFEEGQHQTPFNLIALSIPTAVGRYSLNDARLSDLPANISPT